MAVRLIADLLRSDGEKIEVGIGKDSFDRESKEKLGVAVGPSAEQLIERALKRAVEAYFQDLEKHQYHLTR